MAINTSTIVFGNVVSRDRNSGIESKKTKTFGLAFPLGKRTQKGYLQKESGVELVKNNLRQLLQTEKGERIMLPNYGVRLKRYLFEQLTEETFGSIKQEILTSISRYVKGVKVLKLRVVPIDDFSLEGLQAFRIDLLAQVSDLDGVIVEVGVKLS